MVFNTNVTMHLCETGTFLNGGWLREIRKLSENNHHTSIITTYKSLSLDIIAVNMFSRWTQENYFKYMFENFDFDKMIEYGTDQVDQKQTIPNPVYKKYTYELKKIREKKAILEARVYKKMEESNIDNPENLLKVGVRSNWLLKSVSDFNRSKWLLVFVFSIAEREVLQT